MTNTPDNTKSIAIVVMGDLDRSPRMANHALSALKSNLFSRVDLIGYRGSGLNQELVKHENQGVFRTVYVGTFMVDLLKKLPRALYLLYALLRIIIQTLQLISRLLIRSGRRYDYILVQNPPCVPLLFVCVLVRIATCFRTKIIIDWHNYGFSIMKVNGVNPRIVSMAKFYEMELGKFADFHLTVSEAMKTDLLKQLPTIRESKIQVLYDRATDKFKSVSLNEQFELYERIGLSNQMILNSKEPAFNPDRPVLCLSSTSYTPDEDFNMLVEALDICDKNHKIPAIEMLVTGKGPQKAFYEQVFNARNSKWKKTKIRQAWLQIDDYPKIVSCADLGVCLHASSSGLDLPMKVVDMFSARLPCLALGGFSSIPELVKPEFGLTFLNKQELSEQIEWVLTNFDSDNKTEMLRSFRSNLACFVAPENSWEAQWTRVLKIGVFSEESRQTKEKVN